MRNCKVFKRGGSVNAARPWKLEITGGRGQHAEYEIRDFTSEVDAKLAAEKVRREDLLDLGHDEGYCDLVSLSDDVMASCTCGVQNPCFECGGDGSDNNCVENEEPEDIEYPLCSACFSKRVLDSTVADVTEAHFKRAVRRYLGK